MSIGKASLVPLCVVLLLVVATTPAWANVYASGLSQTGINSMTYILNENADSGVTVEMWEVGGGMVYSENLGAQAKGTQSWTWNGTGYVGGNQYTARVVASDNGYMTWTQINTDATPTSFYFPCGVSVNTNQTSPNFGKIYVSESQGGLTVFGRTVSSGIYMLNADASDDGYANGGKDWAAAGTLAPWKSTIGPDDHLYVTDYSNDLAFEFSGDMSTATQLIDGTNKTAGQYVEGIHVDGTGASRDLYLVNSHYLDGRRGMIKYDIGVGPTVATNDTGTQYIGPGYFAFYPRDVARDSSGDWYMNNFRSTAGQAPPVMKFTDAAPPINVAAWEASSAYTGAYGIDIYEPRGWIAYGGYYNGYVYVFDMATGAYITEFDAGSRIREVAFDAAGNIVTVDNSTEWARIWSPGVGGNSFTTESYFTMVIPEPTSLSALLLGLPVLLFRRRRK